MFEKDYGIQGKGGGVLFYFIYLFIYFIYYIYFILFILIFFLFILKYDYLLKEPQIRRQKKSP